MKDACSWAAQRERGNTALLRAAAWAVLAVGWPLGRALLLPVSAWFLLTSRSARVASRDYLGRALGRPAGLRDVARHFHNFASAVLDRAFLLAGRLDRFQIEAQGQEHVYAALDRGQGCLLLGAHLGSFEVLRSLAPHSPVPVRALMFRRNAGALTRLLDRLDPALAASIIEIGEPGSMLRVRDSVERGEIVGILADRTPARQKQVAVPFLGSPAPFPAGPFILAAALHAPVLLFRAVRTGPRRYAVRFEPFADKVVLRRTAREADLRGWIARYAAAVEAGCRAHPFEWFNFFPFWEETPDADPNPQPASQPAVNPSLPAAGRAGSPVLLPSGGASA